MNKTRYKNDHGCTGRLRGNHQKKLLKDLADHSGWTGAARNAGNTLYIYVCVCVCVHGCTFECQGLEEGSLSLRSCHVSLSSGAHPAWQPHTHSGASSTRGLEETPRLCAMNGCLLTLCFPHHDGLIMTDLSCVGMDVCVRVCF